MEWPAQPPAEAPPHQIELGLSFGVKIGTELGEGSQFAELREVKFDSASNLFHGFDLRR